MKTELTWQGEMAFSAESESGHTTVIDAASEFGGKNAGPRPLELILEGLGGCTAMDVVSILRKMRQEVTAYRVRIDAERAEEHPRVFTGISIEHIISGPGLNETAVRKAVELSDTKYCSASAMLRKAVNIEVKVTVIDTNKT